MNNRIIKFRAWSTTHKKMYDRVLAGPGDPCSIVYDEERKDWVNFDDACGDIMQFTGFIDKNGKEIWEGDLLQGRKGVYWMCRWSNDHARLVVVTPNKYNTTRHTTMIKNMLWAVERLEVIGNIWENSDLLPDAAS